MKIEHAYQCDILIPSMNLVIECDGDYWHGNILFNKNIISERISKQIEYDKIRTNELIEKGFKVLRLWEYEIKKMSLEEFKSILLEVFN
jgi:very-short-patch-repair endonuclease